MRVLLVLALLAGDGNAQPFGTWKLNAARSTFSGGSQPKSLIVRIDAHAKGELFSVDTTERDGRTTSSSTILYLDGAPRRFEESGCSGIQTSWRAEGGTVEVLRMCASGGWMKFVRRTSEKPNELVLETAEQYANGRRFERRLVLEKQK